MSNQKPGQTRKKYKQKKNKKELKICFYLNLCWFVCGVFVCAHRKEGNLHVR